MLRNLSPIANATATISAAVVIDIGGDFARMLPLSYNMAKFIKPQSDISNFRKEHIELFIAAFPLRSFPAFSACIAPAFLCGKPFCKQKSFEKMGISLNAGVHPAGQKRENDKAVFV
jgi:hypothetical protein